MSNHNNPIENLKHQDKVQEGQQHSDSSHVLHDHVHDLRVKASDNTAVNDSTVPQGDAAFHAKEAMSRIASVHDRLFKPDESGTSLYSRMASAEPDLAQSIRTAYMKTAELAGDKQSPADVQRFVQSLRGATA